MSLNTRQLINFGPFLHTNIHEISFLLFTGSYGEVRRKQYY